MAISNGGEQTLAWAAALLAVGLAADPPGKPEPPRQRPGGSNRSPGTLVIRGGFGSFGGFGGGYCPTPYYGGGYYGGIGYAPIYGYAQPAFGLGWEQAAAEVRQQQAEGEAAAANRAAAAKIAAERRAGALRDRARHAEQLGRNLFAAGQYRRAGERWKDALDAEPAPARHFLLAQAKFAQQRFADAAQEVRNGLRAFPDWPNTRFDVRTLYQAEGDFRTQLAALAGQVKANPLDREALFLFGYELFACGRRGDAKTVLDTSLTLEPHGEGIAALLAALKP